MKTRISLFALASLILLALSASPVVAGNKETAIVEESSEVVDALAAIPLKGIPPALLKDAQGVAIFPGVIKAGFIIGGRYGRGVFLVREMGNSWGPPLFLTITGGSLGFQAGAQSTDLILLFKTKPSVERILKGKDKITLGADLAVAAGPVGRQAEANKLPARWAKAIGSSGAESKKPSKSSANNWSKPKWAGKTHSVAA